MFELLVIFFLISLVCKGFIPAILNTLALGFLIIIGFVLYVSLGIWAVILSVTLIGIVIYAEATGVKFG